MRIIFTDHARIRMKERNINVKIVEKILNNPDKVEVIDGRKLYYFGKDDMRKIKIVVSKNKEIFKIITVYPI